MATLYRCKTPTNWLCPCGRVERALRRHGVEHDTVRLDRRNRAAVADLTGQDKVPLVEFDDGEAIVDSKRVIANLEWRRSRSLAP